MKFTHVTMKENCRVLVNKSKGLKLVTDSRSGQILIDQYRIGFKFTVISYEIITDTGFFRTKINQIKIAINFSDIIRCSETEFQITEFIFHVTMFSRF